MFKFLSPLVIFFIFAQFAKSSVPCKNNIARTIFSQTGSTAVVYAWRPQNITGSLTRDFRLQVFFMNQCPPGPQVFHWSHFEFFRKFAEIFANYCLSPVSTTPVRNCSAVSTTPAKNLLPVSLTPAINLCHGF